MGREKVPNYLLHLFLSLKHVINGTIIKQITIENTEQNDVYLLLF